MADRINVCRDGKAIYDIVLTQSFDGLKEAVSCLPVKEHKICIVTDSNVAPLYLEEVRSILSGRRCGGRFMRFRSRHLSKGS